MYKQQDLDFEDIYENVLLPLNGNIIYGVYLLKGLGAVHV